MAGPNPKPTSMRRSFSRWLFLPLILLLAVQLTGLSCLGDWQDAAFSLHSAVHHHVLSDLSQSTATGDDGCPCHLAFVSALDGDYSVTSPVSPFSAGPPATCLCVPSSAPFHPPLGS